MHQWSVYLAATRIPGIDPSSRVNVRLHEKFTAIGALFVRPLSNNINQHML